MELKNFFAQDDQGNKLPGAMCYVYQRGTESLVGSLFKANGLLLANPFTTDANGLAQFATANGLYDVRVVSAGRDYRLTLQFNDVAETVEAAEFAASRAETARDSAVLSTGIKKDIEEGLRTTQHGECFSVLSPSSDEYVILYKNNVGKELEIKRYPSSAYLDSKLAAVKVINPMVPIVVDDANKVALWLNDGKIDGKGVGPEIRKDIGLANFEPYTQSLVPVLVDEQDKVALWLNDGKIDGKGLGPEIRKDIGLTSIQPHESSFVPVIIDDANKVALWLNDGKIDGKGLGPKLTSDVKNIAEQSIANKPADLSQSLTSTGKTLWLYKAKRALLNCGMPTKLKVMFYGDSWSDLATIPNKMGELLGKDYPKAGYGWISALMIQMKDGVTATRPGFTLYDASNTPLAAEFGCAFDGASISTKLATASVKISNLVATKIVIYYRGGSGTFRYRVDGGAWTVAPKGAEAAHEKIIIDGLPDVAHVLDIDTAGNTSSVTLYGFYATRDVSGYEILKCGRGGLRGGYALKYMDVVPQYAADLEADLLIINLGTNDYRSGDWEGYVKGLTSIIAKHREGRPDVGVIIVCPPDSNGVAAVPLTLIREKGYQVSRDSNCEFADVHSIFPKFVKSNALKLWDDDLHVSNPGSDVYCHYVYNKFMK